MGDARMKRRGAVCDGLREAFAWRKVCSQKIGRFESVSWPGENAPDVR